MIPASTVNRNNSAGNTNAFGPHLGCVPAYFDVFSHDMYPRGRRELIISVSGAKHCVEYHSECVFQQLGPPDLKLFFLVWTVGAGSTPPRVSQINLAGSPGIVDRFPLEVRKQFPLQ